MDLTQLVERVSDAETELGVSKLKHNGLSLLPFLRYESILGFRNGQRYQRQKFDHPKLSILGRIKAQWSRMPSTAQFEKTEVLFYDPHQKAVNLEGKEYNHLLDPYFELLQRKNKVVSKTSLIWSDSKPKKDFLYPIEFVIKDTWFGKYLIWSERHNNGKNELHEVVTEWSSAVGVDVNFGHLNNALSRALFSKFIFGKLLKDTNVELILFECYYKPEVFGLIAAARELGIKTIDIQHGKQGTHHLMYSHWKTVPDHGFNIVPDEFWNWGQESVDNISNSSAIHFIQNHTPLSVGYPWIHRCKREMPFKLGKSEKDFMAFMKEKSTVVLVTTQPDTVDNAGCIPDKLYTAMLDSDKETYWLIRLHPSMNRLPDLYIGLLEKDNIDIENATKIPLYALLNISTHHITKFSSVAFEASAFNVPTLIIGEIGRTLFQKQFKAGEFYAENELSINDFISSWSLEFNDSAYFAKFDPSLI